jgi:hypothetical protein
MAFVIFNVARGRIREMALAREFGSLGDDSSELSHDFHLK